MNRNQNKITLDELVSNTIGGEILEFDFKKWKEQHAQDIDKFKTNSRNQKAPINAWRIIMKSKMTKLAVAAVIIAAVLIDINQFGGSIDGTSIVWANVVEAFNKTDNVHWAKTITLHDETVSEKEEIWLKDKVLWRRESRRTVIDDGTDLLVLNEEDRTAQLSDSRAPYSIRSIDFLEIFRNEEARREAGEMETAAENIHLLPDESTDSISVFGLGENDGKAWVDAGTGLPLKVVLERSKFNGCFGLSEKERERRGYYESGERTEIVFDYEPISNEVFSTAIPEGYEVLPREVYPEIMFGRVIDQYGRAVAGAQFYASFVSDECKTDAKGYFSVRKMPDTFAKSIAWTEYPIFVRAFKPDDPYHVAWTLIRDPNNTAIKRLETKTGSTLFSEDEWEQRKQEALEYPRVESPLRIDSRGALDLVIDNEKDFAECVPGDPGELYGGSGERSHNKVRDIVLIMAPGSVLTGRVTDTNGNSLAGVTVTLEEMEIRSGENKIVLRKLGSENKTNWKAFVITDYDGFYELNNLPASWDKVTLRVDADGYKPAELNIKGPGGGGAVPDEPQIIENCHIQLVSK